MKELELEEKLKLVGKEMNLSEEDTDKANLYLKEAVDLLKTRSSL
jgi:hypothetical protein